MTQHTCTGRDSHDCTCDIGHDHTEAQHWTRIREENERRTTAHAAAADLVQRAIAKLEDLRSSATPGPLGFEDDWQPPQWKDTGWTYVRVVAGEPNSISGIRRMVLSTDGTLPGSEAKTRTLADAKLIVTLHGTIDAQLAVLRAAAQHIDHSLGAASHQGPGIELARAILGEEVPA